MRIAFIVPTDILSGGVFVVYEHATRLRKMGHEVTVVFRREKTGSGASSLTGFDLDAIGWESAQSRSFDVVVGSWWENAFDMFSLTAKGYAYFVQSDERRFYPSSSNPEALLAGLSYRLPVRFITEARWIREMLRSEFGKDAAYAPNGVDTTLFFPEVTGEKRDQRLRVLIEGDPNVPYKRVGLAFDVVRDMANIEVWYVSPNAAIDPPGPCDRLFSGVPRTQMRSIYSSCDVLLKLSVVEGCFCPPLEMMACGGTAIVSAVTGHEEFVVHGQNAIVVPLDDRDAARNALTRLRDDRQLLASLQAAGLDTARRLPWEHSTEQFARALESIETEKPMAQHGGGAERLLYELYTTTIGLHGRKSRASEQLSGLQTDIKTVQHELTVFAEQVKMRFDTQIHTRAEAENDLRELDRQFKEIVALIRASEAKLNDRLDQLEQHVHRLQTEVRSLSETSWWSALKRRRSLS